MVQSMRPIRTLTSMSKNKALVLREIVSYLLSQKKYWLVPFCIALGVLAVVLISAQGSVIAPFIYTLF